MSETLGKFMMVAVVVVICASIVIQAVYVKVENRGINHNTNIESSQIKTR